MSEQKPSGQPVKQDETRSSRGTFKPGVSGNPSGRRKTTELSKQVKALVTAELEKDAVKLVKKIKEQALKGCKISQKLWFDKLQPNARPVDAKDASPKVLVSIGQASPKPLDDVEVIEIDPTDVGPIVPSRTNGGTQ